MSANNKSSFIFSAFIGSMAAIFPIFGLILLGLFLCSLSGSSQKDQSDYD